MAQPQGNPHALMQPPISFFRQVLSICIEPSLLKTRHSSTPLFPSDVYDRAERYLNAADMRGGMGAYSNSQGLSAVRRDVAAFISERDGHPCDPDSIFMTDGASDGIGILINLLVRCSEMVPGVKDGILTPVPQYPLYSARLSLLGGELVPYYLDEDKGWTVSIGELERSVQEARQSGTTVRAIVIINPGNPTGQSLAREDVESIVKFAERENLTILADEVYQENIWRADRPFVSFKKVASDLGLDIPLASFHSTSKGFIGECGLRGGYMELVGFPAKVRAEIYKLKSIGLCSNTSGQIMAGLMCQPPRPGDPSHEAYAAERDAILDSLRRRASMVSTALRKLQGVSCQEAEGALYAFPSISLPAGAIREAEAQEMPPDQLYCLHMLEQAGVILVPGSGFWQKPGTFHFRTTILPREEAMPKVLALMEQAHSSFMAKYT